jgi:hypothetical protein
VGAGGGGFVPVARSLQSQAHLAVSIHRTQTLWRQRPTRTRTDAEARDARREAGRRGAPTCTSPALQAGLGLPVGPIEPGLHAIAAILFVVIEPLRPAVFRVRCTVRTPAPCQALRGVAARATCRSCRRPAGTGDAHECRSRSTPHSQRTGILYFYNSSGGAKSAAGAPERECRLTRRFF